MWPRALQRRRGGGAAARERQRRRPGGSAALRAALTTHERARAQRTHLRRLRREASAQVVTLPFVFETELGLPEYERLAADLARRLLALPR